LLQTKKLLSSKFSISWLNIIHSRNWNLPRYNLRGIRIIAKSRLRKNFKEISMYANQYAPVLYEVKGNSFGISVFQEPMYDRSKESGSKCFSYWKQNQLLKKKLPWHSLSIWKILVEVQSSYRSLEWS
jgi:hypothetical protein